MRTVSQFGVDRRRSRIEGRDGRTLLLAIDHGLPAGPIPGIERPAELLRRMRSVPFSGLVVNAGLVPCVSKDIPPEWGLVVHLSAGTLLGSRPTSKVLSSTVEQAISIGADMVSIHVSFGAREEDRMIADAGRVTDAAQSFGVPVLIMAAAEIGASIIQTNFAGSADGVRTIIRGCPVPVVMAGGPRTVSEDAFLESLRESVRAGAAGIAVGRQVFQAPDPAAAAHRIAEVVFGSNRPIPLEAAG